MYDRPLSADQPSLLTAGMKTSMKTKQGERYA
jgi:hypothetical protein